MGSMMDLINQRARTKELQNIRSTAELLASIDANIATIQQDVAVITLLLCDKQEGPMDHARVQAAAREALGILGSSRSS